jgi:hypothetical protein
MVIVIFIFYIKDTKLLGLFRWFRGFGCTSILWEQCGMFEVEVCINSGVWGWMPNFLTRGKMKNLERQIDCPCRKRETCIWSSHSMFWNWETLNYSFEDKWEPRNVLSNLAEYYCAKWLVAKSLARKEYPVNFPQKKSLRTKYLLD